MSEKPKRERRINISLTSWEKDNPLEESELLLLKSLDSGFSTFKKAQKPSQKSKNLNTDSIMKKRRIRIPYPAKYSSKLRIV